MLRRTDEEKVESKEVDCQDTALKNKVVTKINISVIQYFPKIFKNINLKIRAFK